MATAKILDQSLETTKDKSAYNSEGSFTVTPAFDAQISGDIAGSFFSFDLEDAKKTLFTQLQKVYRQQMDVVIAIEADGQDIDYIESGLTKISFNKDGTFAIYNPDFEKLPVGVLADVSIRFLLTPPNATPPVYVINTTTLQITGTNEAPLIVSEDGDHQGSVTEGVSGTEEVVTHEVTGTIAFTDIDQTDRPTASESTKSISYLTDVGESVLTDTQRAAIEAAFSIAAAAGNTNDGSYNWTYAISEDSLNFLAESEVVTAVFTVTVDDQNGGTVSQDVTITINGTNDAPVIKTITATGSLTERVGTEAGTTEANATGTITIQDLDNTDQVTLSEVFNNDMVWSGGTITDKELTATQIQTLIDGFVLNDATALEIDDTTNEAHSGWTYTTNEDLNFLADGETLTFSFSVTATDDSGASTNTSPEERVTITITGTNDAPTVAAALSSKTDEEQPRYTINLLEGAADIDHGAVLKAIKVAEKNNNDVGWTLNNDNTITIDPFQYDELDDGQSASLDFSYQVEDEHGATVDQTLHVDIAGFTDTPTLAVTTSAGNDANEVILHVESTRPHTDERVKLEFLDLPVGARVFDGDKFVDGATDVTTGIDSLFDVGSEDVTRDFTVVLDPYQDQDTPITVKVTAFHPAPGDPLKELSSSQAVELHYDVNHTDQQEIAFTNTDQNMWGDFGSDVIGWHEYLPILGTDYMQWQNGEWVDTSDNGDNYWRVDDIDLLNISLNMSATDIIKAVEDGIKQINAETQGLIDDANNALIAALSRTTTEVALYDARNFVYISDPYLKNDEYEDVNHPVWKVATLLQQLFVAPALSLMDANNLGHNYGNVLESAYTSVSAYAALSMFNGKSLDAALHDAAWYVAGPDWTFGTGDISINQRDFWNALVDIFVTPGVAVSEAVTAVINAVKVIAGSAFDFLSGLADSALNTAAKAVQEIYSHTAELTGLPDFDLKNLENSSLALDLSLDADAFGRVGVQIDAELDGGSVDTNVQYQFSSKTEYNQTTDMLAITPTLVNVTDGSVAAFSTASPNITFSAKLLYDVGAALDMTVDGELKLAGNTIALDGNADGSSINFSPVISTGGTNMQFDLSKVSTDVLPDLLKALAPIIYGGNFLELVKFFENKEAWGDISMTMSNDIVPYTELFILPSGIKSELPDLPVDELTIVNFDTKEENALSFLDGLVELDPADVINGAISGSINTLTEGMIESFGINLPSIQTEGSYVSPDDLKEMYTDTFEYLVQEQWPFNYDADEMTFGQLINEYYYDEYFSIVNPDQLLSIIEGSEVTVGDRVLTVMGLESDELRTLGYSELADMLMKADVGSLLDLLPEGSDVTAAMKVALSGLVNEIAGNFTTLLDGIGGTYDTGTLIKVDMTNGETDALFHFNTFNFNTDDILTDIIDGNGAGLIDEVGSLFSPYKDPDINPNTASFGLFAASGESDKVFSVKIDMDNVLAFIIKQVIAAVTVEIGQVVPPELTNPFDLSLSLDTLLKIVEVDPKVADPIKEFIDFNLEQEKMDYDITFSNDFSQDFTLTVDDMAYVLTFTETADEKGENAKTMTFKASDADKLIIADASQYDVNKDGQIDYDLEIVPTAMFSNDTELGYNFAPSFDFLKTVLKGEIKLPLDYLTGIDALPTLKLGFNYTVGPILELDTELNGLDIDVYESRFNMDIGSVDLADNSVNINLIGVQDSADLMPV